MVGRSREEAFSAFQICFCARHAQVWSRCVLPCTQARTQERKNAQHGRLHTRTDRQDGGGKLAVLCLSSSVRCCLRADARSALRTFVKNERAAHSTAAVAHSFFFLSCLLSVCACFDVATTIHNKPVSAERSGHRYHGQRKRVTVAGDGAVRSARCAVTAFVHFHVVAHQLQHAKCG